MKGFIIASVNPKNVKQAAGLEAHLISYTPVMCEDANEIPEQFSQALPDHMILMTIPVEVLKKNIKVLEIMAQQNNLVLEN